LERHLLASSYALFDWLVREGKLDKVSCKDLGAGGVVCASVEQLTEYGFGAEVELDNVHVERPGFPAEVIACAETQERLCFTCHPDLTDSIVEHFNVTWDLPSVAENARASVIGKITPGGNYRCTYKGEVVCDATADAMTCGIQYERPTELKEIERNEPEIVCDGNMISVGSGQWAVEEIFQAMLAHPNHACKDPAMLHFDKNVIGNTVVEAGEADAGVIAPLQDLQSYAQTGDHPGWDLSEEEKWRGAAVAADGNGRYGRISPYWQGVNATLESMRNVVAVGATPRALTDCLNYSNPEIPEELAALEHGVRGIIDTTKGIQFDGEPVAIISGNVSFYNRGIDPLAVVCCAGVLADARKAVTMQLKQSDSSIVLIGKRKDECGGSAYYQLLEELSGADRDSLLGSSVPKPDFSEANTMMQSVLDAIETENVLSCHDISDGGLLLAAFEMLLPQRKLGGKIGMDLNLEAIGSELSTDKLLFSESGGFLLEMSNDKAGTVADAARKAGLEAHIIGKTTKEPVLTIKREQHVIIEQKLQDLLQIWLSGLKTAL
ncbi:MAG: AIR synthase-related protein, partial [Candidatus Peribacteraceae bacterium]|nr:AIR synthase-related protein [Candidatus Peribacteraceae bacterium]